MKIITMCGSLRFKDQMIETSLKVELQGNCVLTPPYPLNDDKDNFSEKEIKVLDDMHKVRIKMSDAILVMNVDNYIGESTKKEIEYAKSLNKEIIYYTDIIESDGDK